MDEKLKKKLEKIFTFSHDEKFLYECTCTNDKKGNFYVTQDWILFHASSLTKKIHIQIPFNEIKSVEKKTSTHSIEIVQSNGNKCVFTAFSDVDAAYEHVMERVNHFHSLAAPSNVVSQQQESKDNASENKSDDSKKDKEEISGELHIKLQYVAVATENSSDGITARLIVELLEARNLAAKNKDGTSDPYAIIKVGKKEDKSKTIKKNLNPVWNEKFEFKLKASYGSVLQLIVWDWNALSHSEYMGEVNIPLSSIESNRVIDQWFPLGDTHSIAVIEPESVLNKQESQTSLSQSPMKQEATPIKQEPPSPIKQESLTPTKQEPQSFLTQDSFTTSEPLQPEASQPAKQEATPVKQEATPAIPVKQEPPTKPESIEPQNPPPFESSSAQSQPAPPAAVSVPPQLQAAAPLKTSTERLTDSPPTPKVNRTETQSSESSPGPSTPVSTPRQSLTSSTTIQNPDTASVRAQHPLQADDPLSSSSSALSTALTSDEFVAVTSKIDKEYISGDVHLRVIYLMPTQEKSGGLLIEVLEARNLAAKDKSGTSDPYIAFHLGKAEKKTRVVKKNLNPVYNEKLEFEVKYPVASDEELVVIVWDWNAITARTFMGQFSVPLSSLEPNKTYDTYYPLDKKKLSTSTSNLTANTTSTTQTTDLPKRILLPETAPAAIATTNIEDIYDSLLINNPQERVRRQLERQYKQQRALAALVYSVFVWKRPIHFGVIYTTSLFFVWLFFWLDFTLITSLCLCLFTAVQIWWMSDFIKLDIPWQSFLKDSDPDPTNAFDLMAFCKVTYDDLLVTVTRMKEREPAEFTRRVMLALLTVTFVSGICGSFLLSFLVVTALLTAPGVFVNYGDTLKDKINSFTKSKKTN